MRSPIESKLNDVVQVKVAVVSSFLVIVAVAEPCSVLPLNVIPSNCSTVNPAAVKAEIGNSPVGLLPLPPAAENVVFTWTACGAISSILSTLRHVDGTAR